MMTPMTFAAPGPGSWQLDAVHFPRPVTRLLAETFPANFEAGFRAGVRAYGSLLDTLEFAVVNGFIYFAPRPVGAPKGAKGPPPKPILQILLRVHPEMRRRVATARETFARKPWREELRTWDEVRKPAAIRTHLALQSVDLSALDTSALVAHLERCRTHWGAMIEQHHRLDATAVVPVGDFIMHAAEWTGLEPAKLCALLSGASGVSSGESPELARLEAALRDDPSARTLIGNANTPADAIASLRHADGELGAAARSWLDLVSHRLQNGLDIAEPTNGENPDLLLTTIRRALDRTANNRRSAGAAETAAIRDRVPPEHRAEFDELLTEARLIYRLRDERGLYSDIWAAGIMRRAVLEAGRRLAEAGRLTRPDLTIDATVAEIRVLLAGGSDPSSAELAARAQHRVTASQAEVPATLGPVSSGPPPAAWLPPATARLEQAVGACISGIFNDSTSKNDAQIVRGLGVSAGTVEGTARVVHDVNGFEHLRQGDILVTRSTTAAFNVVLPLLSGIVTDRGGSLSHAAIVAREYGIPAVVGSREATRIIPNGARIRLDGTLGEAVVL